MTSKKPSLHAMIFEGAGVLRRYPGLCAALYAVQFFVALLVGWMASNILAAAFAEQPLFDQAVDGDFAALVFVISDAPEVLASIFWMAAFTIVGYAVLSWFLIGGLNATLIQRPTGRRAVAGAFGTGGAVTFFAYLRLALVSLIPNLVILGVLAWGFGNASDSLRYGLTGGDVARALIPNLLPAAVLIWIHQSAVDYARLELSQHAPLSSTRALLRCYRTVLTDWRPLVHLLLYVVFFVVVSLVFVALFQGRPMAGTAGAILIFAIRQLVALLRFGGKMVCAAGQAVYAVRGRVVDSSGS